MVIFGVPAVVTFCSGALILGWAGTRESSSFLRTTVEELALLIGQLFLGNTVTLLAYSSIPFNFSLASTDQGLMC